jgi:hypothetical protein
VEDHVYACIESTRSCTGDHPLAKKEAFFDEQLDQSDAKARIIQKYFYAWAKVITPTA